MWTFVNRQRSFFITNNGLKLEFPPDSLRVVEEKPRTLTVYNHVVDFVLYLKEGRIYAWFLEARKQFLLDHIPPPLKRRLLG